MKEFKVLKVFLLGIIFNLGMVACSLHWFGNIYPCENIDPIGYFINSAIISMLSFIFVIVASRKAMTNMMSAQNWVMLLLGVVLGLTPFFLSKIMFNVLFIHYQLTMTH